jgi:hypothetical protein
MLRRCLRREDVVGELGCVEHLHKTSMSGVHATSHKEGDLPLSNDSYGLSQPKRERVRRNRRVPLKVLSVWGDVVPHVTVHNPTMCVCGCVSGWLGRQRRYTVDDGYQCTVVLTARCCPSQATGLEVAAHPAAAALVLCAPTGMSSVVAGSLLSSSSFGGAAARHARRGRSNLRSTASHLAE